MSIYQNDTFLRFKRSCRNYGRNLVDIATRAILLVAGVAVLNVMLLYFYNILWHIYRLTYIGRQFVVLHPEQTRLVSMVLSDDITGLSIHTTLAAFVICMLASALCQIFYITRFFYEPRGIIGKFIWWGLPLTALVSIFVNHQYGFKNWAAVIPVTIVPTLGVFTYCFQFSRRLLPEIGDVIKAIFLLFRTIIIFTLGQRRQQDLPPS